MAESDAEGRFRSNHFHWKSITEICFNGAGFPRSSSPLWMDRSSIVDRRFFARFAPRATNFRVWMKFASIKRRLKGRRPRCVVTSRTNVSRINFRTNSDSTPWANLRHGKEEDFDFGRFVLSVRQLNRSARFHERFAIVRRNCLYHN